MEEEEKTKIFLIPQEEKERLYSYLFLYIFLLFSRLLSS
jgi:hypothetical protein